MNRVGLSYKSATRGGVPASRGARLLPCCQQQKNYNSRHCALATPMTGRRWTHVGGISGQFLRVMGGVLMSNMDLWVGNHPRLCFNDINTKLPIMSSFMFIVYP